MFKLIKQLFCKHEHELMKKGWATDGSGKVSNFTCKKCGYESHRNEW